MAGDIEIKLPSVRLSFSHIFAGQPRYDDKTKELTGYGFNASLLVPKTDTVTIALIKEAMKKAKDETWGTSPPPLQPDQLCLRDGEPADMDGNRAPLYDGYAGMFYVSANRPVKVEEYEAIKAGRKRRPVRVIGPRKNPETGRFDELDENDQYAPYSGCYVNAIIRIYGYPGKNGQKSRINASLEAIQFVRDGDRFGARPVDVDSAFDEEDAPVDDIGGAPAKQPVPAGDGFDIG